MHGVGRWDSNCGCNAGGNGLWKQEWRRPLREALDWLRDELAARYEVAAKELFRDPWTARDEYARVVIDHSTGTVDRFLEQQAVGALSRDEAVRALRLLEMQRHLMLMYTSCGWFFDEPTGPETVQVLQYAGRAVQLSEQLFGGEREEQFLARLERVRSNIPEFGNGRNIYEKFVRPAMLDLCGVAAHYAISSLFDGYRDCISVYCYRAHLEEVHVVEKGRTKLATGRAQVLSRSTRGELKFGLAVLYLGDHKLVAGICPCPESDAFRLFVEQVSTAFSAQDLARCASLMDERFRVTYSLKSLFHDERRRIVRRIVDSTLADTYKVYAGVYEQHASLINFLSELQIPMPAILRVSVDFVLGNAIQRCLADEKLDIDQIRTLLDTARQNASSLADCSLEPALRQRLEMVLDAWAKDPFDLRKLEELEALVLLAGAPPFRLDLWQAQNVYYERLQVISREQPIRFSGKWLDCFQRVGELLGVAVDRSLLARSAMTVAIQPAYSDSALVQNVVAAASSDTVVLSSDRARMPAESV